MTYHLFIIIFFCYGFGPKSIPVFYLFYLINLIFLVAG